jgi:hypothetical protein
MMDRALLERALQLDESARRELIALLQESLDDEAVSPEIAALIDERVAEADADPGASVSVIDFEREVRARRQA